MTRRFHFFSVHSGCDWNFIHVTTVFDEIHLTNTSSNLCWHKRQISKTSQAFKRSVQKHAKRSRDCRIFNIFQGELLGLRKKWYDFVRLLLCFLFVCNNKSMLTVWKLWNSKMTSVEICIVHFKLIDLINWYIKIMKLAAAPPIKHDGWCRWMGERGRDLNFFSKIVFFFISLIDRECRDSSTSISTWLVKDA